MTTLIFSDSHLSDEFDASWLHSILPLIKKADRVIINGDFWDGQKTDFHKFIHSAYRQTLFPALRPKTDYIFGNHDPQFIQDERMDLFSRRQANQFEFNFGTKKVVVEHGHLIAPGYDNCCHLNKFALRSATTKALYKRIDRLNEGTNLLARCQQWLIKRKEKKMLRQLATYSQKEYQPQQIFIFGHRHTPKHCLTDNFIILGSYRFHHQRYLWLENNQITPVDHTYN